MTTQLKRLRLNRIDLVDKGANPGAHVVLFKRDTTEAPVSDQTFSAEDVAAIQKQLDEANQKLQDAEAKLAESGKVSKRVDDLEKRLAERDDEVRELREANEMRDAIAKAQDVEPLFGPAEEFAGILRKIHNTLNEDERKVWTEKVSGAVTMVKDAAHFRELGAGGEAGGSGDSYQKLEKAATAKYPDVSKADAVAKFIGTPEGRKLYRDTLPENQKH